jgi:hypothetical protein
LVLLPLGHEWPDENRTVFSLEELLQLCGGDLARIREAELSMSPERFIATHTKELESLDGEEMIVGLAPRSGPMSMGEILATRGWLEGELPFLSNALWILFVNEEEEFFLLRQLEEQGAYDARLKSLDEPPPVWTRHRCPEQKFLVLLTRACDPGAIHQRAEEHFAVMRFRRTDKHPATIPVSSDPPLEIQSFPIPRPARLPALSSSGLRILSSKPGDTKK